MLAAILLTLFATANARGAFAIPAFGAFIMLAATLRPSRRVLRRAGGQMRALVSRVRRLHAIKATIERTPRPRARPGPSGPVARRRLFDFSHEISALVLSRRVRRSNSLRSGTRRFTLLWAARRGLLEGSGQGRPINQPCASGAGRTKG
jgi:hypothetical protein